VSTLHTTERSIIPKLTKRESVVHMDLNELLYFY